MKEFLADSDRERFVVVCSDKKNQPTAINICHVGSLNASLVHPREVMKAAILANGASIIVGHNHPSQDATPSREHCEVTKRLVEAGKIIGIDVLDDLIVCEEKFVSLKEKGYICRERCLELPEICRDLQSKRVFVNSTKNKVTGPSR